jgi:hypothetical protein
MGAPQSTVADEATIRGQIQDAASQGRLPGLAAIHCHQSAEHPPVLLLYLSSPADVAAWADHLGMQVITDVWFKDGVGWRTTRTDGGPPLLGWTVSVHQQVPVTFAPPRRSGMFDRLVCRQRELGVLL